MKKLLVNAATVLAAVFIGWFFLSFIDVIVHNNANVPIYHNWNLFQIFWG